MAETNVVLLTAEMATKWQFSPYDCLRGARDAIAELASGRAICKSAAAEREQQERIRQLTEWYDRQNGTPCEQIRHAQEIERLQERIAALEVEVAGLKLEAVAATHLIQDRSAQVAALRSLLRELAQAMSWDCDENWHGDLKDRVDAALQSPVTAGRDGA